MSSNDSSEHHSIPPNNEETSMDRRAGVRSAESLSDSEDVGAKTKREKFDSGVSDLLESGSDGSSSSCNQSPAGESSARPSSVSERNSSISGGAMTLKDKRTVVVEQLKKMQAETEPILAMFMNPEVTRQIQSSRDSRQLLDYLTKNHGLKPEMLDKLYLFAKFQYECGNYSGAAEYLHFHRFLVTPNDKNYLNGLWGKLASEILMQNWDTALEDLNRLKEYIDSNTFNTPLQALQQRTWLIHWSLFIFFNHAKGRDLIVEMLLYQNQYLNAIETMCPHILRYLTTAVIINKQNRRTMLKDLVKVIQQESYAYRDPITEFIEHLYVNFDFDAAQQKLRQCKDVLLNDFFLVAVLDDFIENARLMIFETFCRIHQCISIK
uniref:EOG090X0491 n=1 Tax=Daphnia magna TaxID=35525 RepID=A0A4Y7ML58_9CRUS|nr:EOG090X0491 [Daphnia magna]